MSEGSYKVLYFVEGKLLGTGTRDFQRIHNEIIPPVSLAFFCPVCAEVWARVVVENGTKHFQVYTASCRKHPRFPSAPAGSLWMSWDREWNDTMPKAVLEREILVLCDHWDYYKGEYRC